MKFNTCTRRRGIGRSGSRQRLEHANEGSHRACAGADPDIDSGRAKPDAVRFSNEPANQSGDAACENRIADRLSGSLGICPILPRTRIAIYHEQPVAFGEEWAQHGSALVPRDQHTDPARSILREQGCRCHFRPVSSEPHRSKLARRAASTLTSIKPAKNSHRREQSGLAQIGAVRSTPANLTWINTLRGIPC